VLLNNHLKTQENFYSDATLEILTSSQNPNFKVKFMDMFPITLSTLQFDATSEDISYLTADVSFKYTLFNITDLSGNKL
jgi:ATP-dependent Lon protease